MEIVNTQVPVTSERSEQYMQEILEKYPAVRTEVLGSTAYQRPIRALLLGSGPRKVLFTAAHHANEWITALVLLKYAEELAAAQAGGGEIGGISAETLLSRVTVYLVPLVNPDGTDLVTGAIGPGDTRYLQAEKIAAGFPEIPFPAGWKANLLGVDLNLNYPALWLRAREIKYAQGYIRPAPRDYVGRAPFNQLETQALGEYTRRLNPDLVLALHSQGEEIYWQFREIPVPGARELGEKMAAASGYRLAEPAAASGYGGYKDWFLQEFRKPGYTVEVGKGVNPLPLDQFPEIYRKNLGLLNTAALGE